MYYYQFNIGDYASHTPHLDPLEDIAYRRMLDYCYLNEIGLPQSVEEIARLIRMRSHSDCIANVLREFFVLDENKTYRSPRAEKEISLFRAKSQKAAKSARKRWENTDAKALPTQCEGNANHKPRNENHKPRTKKDSGAVAPELVLLFSEFWDSWPSGFGDKGSRKNAEAAFLKLKPDKPLVDMMARAVVRQHADKQQRVATGQFCPNFKHVERWIKNREWENEIEHQRPVRQSRSDAIESALDEAFGRTAPGVLEGDFQRVDSHAPDDFPGRHDFEDMGGWPE